MENDACDNKKEIRDSVLRCLFSFRSVLSFFYTHSFLFFRVLISPLNICSSLPLFFHFLSPFFNSLSLFFYSLSLFFNSLLFVFHSISLFFHCIPLLFLSLSLTCSSFHRVLIIILPTLPSSECFVLTSRSSLPHKPVHSLPLPFIVPGFVRSPFSLFPYLRFHSCLPLFFSSLQRSSFSSIHSFPLHKFFQAC